MINLSPLSISARLAQPFLLLSMRSNRPSAVFFPSGVSLSGRHLSTACLSYSMVCFLVIRNDYQDRERSFICTKIHQGAITVLQFHQIVFEALGVRTLQYSSQYLPQLTCRRSLTGDHLSVLYLQSTMKRDPKKYHHYSLAFYGKDEALFEVTKRSRQGFSNLDHYQKNLKPRSIELFKRFSSELKAQQQKLLEEESQTYVDVFMDIIKHLNGDRDLMEFVLPTFDAIITQERRILRQVVEIVARSRKQETFLKNLKTFIYVPEHRAATVEAAVRILSTVIGQLPKSSFADQQKSFLLQLMHINKTDGKPKISDFCMMNSIVHLIKHDELTRILMDNGGVQLIIDALNRYSTDIQVVYYAFLNIWMLSYIEEAYPKYLAVPKFGIIRLICEILQKISRDKLVRVAFFIFKNLQNNQNCLELMMDVGLLKIIDTLLKGNIKDSEIVNNIKSVAQTLEQNIRILSSFDKYVKQINAEYFEWSSVHTERFWKQNATKFEQNDYQLIKKLKEMLGSQRLKNVAIACYDLGEFCRFYPHGRNIIDSLKIKETIMDKAKRSEDKNIREQALLALQKIMIQNWQAI